jgi:hypothetical protein
MFDGGQLSRFASIRRKPATSRWHLLQVVPAGGPLAARSVSGRHAMEEAMNMSVTQNLDSGTPAAREERIRELAYAIWEEEGCPEGRADDHWHKAVAIIEAQDEVELKRNPDWLKRSSRPVPANQTTGEPAGLPPPQRLRRAAAG